MDYQNIINNISNDIASLPNNGEVASYITELEKISPHKFGVCLSTLNQEKFFFSDAHESFSIQSIAKVLAMVLAYQKEGKSIWKRVGVEPSGNPFNSLVQLEYEKGIPRNPLNK